MNLLRSRIGGFYLVERIGSGVMSEVYLGINPRSREKRAFKIVSEKASMSAEAYARFLREVEIIRALSHPGINTILDSGAEDGICFYSAEYFSGGSLASLMERGRIPLEESVELFFPICAAMAHAHERGVIHRDLKPANILLRDDGRPVICNFGIAGGLESDTVMSAPSGLILGSIAYLAPEQRFSMQQINRKSDVYALGAIFYEMVMGFPPLGQFPWPREVMTTFPEMLQEILERCLESDPDSRYENAGVLESELSRCPGIQKIKMVQPADGPGVRIGTRVDHEMSVTKDRIVGWFRSLRNGTAKERLETVRDMVESLTPAEAKAILKIYPEEGDRVRWGLIRVLGELRISAATQLILNDLGSPFHTECAMEALGKIGAEEAYDAILKYISTHPGSAGMALLPLARTGKEKAVGILAVQLESPQATLRQRAVQALVSIPSEESLQVLRMHFPNETDDWVRAFMGPALQALEDLLIPENQDAG